MGHLSTEQRYTISAMYAADHSQKSIALAIGKDKSVVSRELKRNSDQRNGEYRHELAVKKAKERQAQKRKRCTFTASMRSYVDAQLSEHYSPEQISGRAKLQGKPCVSHERIYLYIWQNKRSGGRLFENLRHNGRKYRKRGHNKDKRGILTGRVDIDQRPAIVAEKTRFGDLEIDTVIGKNHQGALLTINDRVTSIVWIRRLEGKDSAQLAEAAIEALLPWKDLIHTITSDNGKEFAQHQHIAQTLNIDMFFAKPYHSWQRGANENTNGLIRQYFKKGSSFENITPEQVQKIQDKLNNRPRKKLGFQTPNEFFKHHFFNKKVAFVN